MSGLTGIDTSGLERAIKKLGEQASADAARTLHAAVLRAAPLGSTTGPIPPRRPHGFLRQGIRLVLAGLTHRITVEADYARFVDEGTRPHIIRGNPLLRFYWPRVGAVVFFRHVHHPGTPATKFFSRNVTSATWSAALRRAVSGITIRA